MSTLIGSKLDKYEIVCEVGHGGMAVVYRGRDSVLDREVAVKVLHPHLAAREESRMRLRREALTVAKLRHENILEIYDYSGEDVEESYLVTEFIHGMTLREWLDTRWRPRPALAALVIHRLCVALHHAHSAGVVHRDLKPENVMIREDGVLKLMDFGIAQILDTQKLTLTGQLLGSPAYMAPELISGKPLDARTDLFAVGIMLYQLATGALPFSGRNPHEVLNRIMDADYPPPATICPLVDEDLEKIIARALAQDPDDRYQDAKSLASDLEDYLEFVGVPPLHDEVTGYFTRGDAYVQELDKRVCNALMDHADEASKRGQSARAIRLLGRVLELEEDQKQARMMLSRLRTRERRMKSVMVGVAGMVGVGLLSAGGMWLYLSPPIASRLFAPEEPPVLEPETVDYVVSGVKKPVKPTPKTPLKTETETETETAPEQPPGKSKVTIRGPNHNTPKPKHATAECTLILDGIPLSTARAHHKLMVDGRVQKIDDLSIPITFDRESANVQLVGTGTNSRYLGLWAIRSDDCQSGKVVRKTVSRKPARLLFSGLPANTAVECISGGCPPQRTSLAEKYPVIRMKDDSAELTLKFKSEGYEPKTKKMTIYPGNNPISVELQPRD